MLVSVIVPAYRGGALLRQCAESVLASRGVDVELILVDNQADAATRTVIDAFEPRCLVLRMGANLGWAGGSNAGLAAARGRYLALLNDDAVVEPDWLAAALAAFEQAPPVGVVGGKILSWDRSVLEHAGGCIDPATGITSHRGYGQADDGRFDEPLDVPYVTGAAMVLDRALYERLGPFEPSYFMYYEEVEYCLAAWRLGLRVRYEPRMVVVHKGRHASGGLTPRYYFLYHRSRLRFLIRNMERAALPAHAWRELSLYRARGQRWPLLRAHLAVAASLPAIWRGRRQHQRMFQRLLGGAPTPPH